MTFKFGFRETALLKSPRSEGETVWIVERLMTQVLDGSRARRKVPVSQVKDGLWIHRRS